MAATQNTQSGHSTWQRKLLPFMVIMIAGLTIFFFLASFYQFFLLDKRIQDSPTFNELLPALNQMIPQDTSLQDENKLLAIQWKTLSLLESHVLQRRYHQANVLLIARVWTRYLGFVTGMILSLVGAAFILGKLREAESKVDTEGGPWKVSVATTSPGLLLAVLGTLLMLTTMVSHYDIGVQDANYIQFWYQNTPSGGASLPKPADLLSTDSRSRTLSDAPPSFDDIPPEFSGGSVATPVTPPENPKPTPTTDSPPQ